MAYTMPDPKDPAAVLDYKFDFAPRTNGNTDPTLDDWLESAETIDDFSVSASAVSSGCVVSIVNSYLTDSNKSVTVWVGGGDNLCDYDVTCHIYTSSSPVTREDERTIRIQVRNR